LQGESLGRKQLAADIKWEPAAFLNDLLYGRILYKGAIQTTRETFSFLFHLLQGSKKKKKERKKERKKDKTNIFTLSTVVSAERIEKNRTLYSTQYESYIHES